jgi:hypothetical protein
VISQELSDKEVGPEGKGKSMEDGGYELFSVSSICGVNVSCVPNFCIVVFQHLLSLSFLFPRRVLQYLKLQVII